VHGDILILLLVVILGVAAFFFGVLYMLWEVLATVFRGARRALSPRGRGSKPSPPAARPVRSRTFRVCQNPRCRHVEQRAARFCSQCGGELADGA